MGFSQTASHVCHVTPTVKTLNTVLAERIHADCHGVLALKVHISGFSIAHGSLII